MKKNVLVIAPAPDTRWSAFEKAMVDKGLQVLRVSSLQEALYRLENELFTVVVLQDDSSGTRQREMAEGLKTRPFGQITPFVVVGPEEQPAEKILIASVLDQYFPFSTDPGVLADFLLEMHELRNEKDKRGKLGPVTFPQVLYRATYLRISGAVAVERADERCVIYLENGRVVFASSNRDETRFGEFLVSRGVITRDQQRHAVEIMQSEGKRIGKVLVEQGFLKPQVLQTLLQSQIKHIIFSVFNWTGCEFYVLFDERCDPSDAILHVDTTSLILEGIRLTFTESELNAEFEPFDAKASLAVPIEEIQRRLHLGKNEIDFLKLVGAGRPMQELLNLNSYSRLDSLKLLYGFLVLGLLALEKEVRAPRPEVSHPEEKPRDAEKPQNLPKPSMPKRAVKKPGGRRSAYLVGTISIVFSLAVLFFVFSMIDMKSVRERWLGGSGRSFIPDSPPEGTSVHILRPKAPPAVPSPAPSIPPKETEPVPASPGVHEMVRFKRLLEVAASQRKEGRLNDALATNQRALEINPKDVFTNLEVADLLLELDRSQEALDVLERVKKLDPSDPRPYLAAGTIHLMRNQSEPAKVAFRAYLSMIRVTPETRSRVSEVKRILKSLETQR